MSWIIGILVFWALAWAANVRLVHSASLRSVQPAVIKDYAKENLVLLELDFPRGKRLSPDLVAQNEKLQDEFKVQGFPTILLLDGEGRPFGRTGIPVVQINGDILVTNMLILLGFIVLITYLNFPIFFLQYQLSYLRCIHHRCQRSYFCQNYRQSL